MKKKYVVWLHVTVMAHSKSIAEKGVTNRLMDDYKLDTPMIEYEVDDVIAVDA